MAGLPVRRAPYKDFLQPALQRRFASTATVLLAVTYAEAVLLSQWNSFVWTWFPLGPTGIRAAFLFVCGLAILILRIAHYHVGLRTTGSGFQTLKTNLTSLSTYETAFWYFFSAFLFNFVFLWSMPSSANLGWITYFGGYRARANERPLFLASYMAYCALKQSIDHFIYDADRLDLNITSKHNGSKVESQGSSASLKAALLRLPAILADAVQQALMGLAVASVIYLFLLRSFIWGWALVFLRPFYTLPKSNMVPPTWPLDFWVLVRCLMAGSMLFFVWRAGNTAFSIFMVKEPLKNGQPLTSESKDPNGSLLNGLKSKKFSIQCFAMWELSHIAQRYDVRRQAIYADIDRKNGPMWSQVYSICMDVVKGIETRVDLYANPPVPPTAESVPVADARHRTSVPLRDEAIYNTATSQVSNKMMKLIGQGGQSVGSGSHGDGASSLSKLSPLAKKTWKNTKDQLLSREGQEAGTPNGVRGQIERISHQLMWFPWVNALVRQSFRLELAGVVLGTPHAEPSFYCNAVNSLCQLAVHSLGEDQFGNVHRDVPIIIRTLTSIIRKVEDVKQVMPVHWTDAENPRSCDEVEQVLDALRSGLSQVVTSFEPFCNDLRLTPGDLRLAKEASTKPKPQVEKKPVERPLFKDAPAKTGEGQQKANNSMEAGQRRRQARSEREERKFERASERVPRANLSRRRQNGPEMEQVR